MSLIKFSTFTGEIPRIPQQLLPDNAAHTALNGDFSAGELRGMQDSVVLKTLSSAARSIYTEDGVNYYAWNNTTEVCKSQVVGDTKKRICYTTANGGDTRFVSMIDEPPTQSAGTPVGYKLGVPAPEATLGGTRTAQPLIARALNYAAFDSSGFPIVTGNTQPVTGWLQLADGMTFEVRFFYESGGKRYQEMTLPIKFYSGGESDFRAQPAPTTKYSDQTLTSNPANWAYVYGRSFGCVVPLMAPAIKVTASTVVDTGSPAYTKITSQVGSERDTTEVVPSTSGSGSITYVTNESVATPVDAKPVLHITAKIGQQVAFSVYSEGSVSASTSGVTLNAKLLSVNSASMTYEVIPKFAVEDSRAYVYTYVNIYGDESAPSKPVSIDIDRYQTVELSGTFVQLTGYAPIDICRTYATGSQAAGNTDYFFNSEGHIANRVLNPGESIAFSGAQPNKPQDLDEVIATIGWDVPPSGLTGLVNLPNGIMAGFRNTRGSATTGSGPGENEIWFCEPYKPHAWPAKYAKTLPFNVVNMIAHGGSLVVTTTSHPYIISGVHPAAMSETKLSAVQAGVGRATNNKQTICDVGSGVVYISNDGLVLVNGLGATLDMSERFFTRQKWREFYGQNSAPGSTIKTMEYMRLAYQGGYLIGYFDGRQGFVIRIDEAAGTFTRSSVVGVGHFNSSSQDTLILIDNGNLKQFAASDYRLPYAWESKFFVQDRQRNFGAYQIVVTGSGTVLAYVGADENNIASTQTITFDIPEGFTNRPYVYNGRLKSGFLARKVWVSFVMPGTIVVNNFFLATTMMELQHG